MTLRVMLIDLLRIVSLSMIEVIACALPEVSISIRFSLYYRVGIMNLLAY